MYAIASRKGKDAFVKINVVTPTTPPRKRTTTKKVEAPASSQLTKVAMPASASNATFAMNSETACTPGYKEIVEQHDQCYNQQQMDQAA
jgi:hypothetical protein